MRVAVACLIFCGVVVAGTVRAQVQSPTAPPPAQPTADNSNPFLASTDHREFNVTGTVVSNRGGRLVVRIDDHHHAMPFQLNAGEAADARPGSRVEVRYHPTGATGQAADDVKLLEPARGRTAKRQGR